MAVESHTLPAPRRGFRAPWSFYLFRRSPFGALTTGIGLALLLFVSLVSLELFTGRPQALLRGVPPADVGCAYLRGDYRIAVVGIILLLYSAAARFVLACWTRETAALLGRGEFLDADSLAANRAWGFMPGLLGIAICLGFAIDIAERSVEWTRDYWILPHIINWTWCIPFGWVGGRLIYALIVNAVLISRAARRIEVRDLDETGPLEAAVRHGLRSALLSLILLGLISVHFVDPGLGFGAVVFVGAMLVVGTTISTLPAIGVAKVLYDKRDEQLAELRREIQIEEQQLRDHVPGYVPGRIGDIVALEQRLENWHVSVFRFSTFARLVMYAFIGILSWLAAEAVSIVVEDLFGF